MTSFVLNGKSVRVHVDPTTPLLWVLRESFGLTGTKYGCGMALCGACTAHLDGEAISRWLRKTIQCADHLLTAMAGVCSPIFAE
jgi:aerobic-type carbon monoxide dehydrogenase small subunit (CoxS/CutS family)